MVDNLVVVAVVVVVDTVVDVVVVVIFSVIGSVKEIKHDYLYMVVTVSIIEVSKSSTTTCASTIPRASKVTQGRICNPCSIQVFLIETATEGSIFHSCIKVPVISALVDAKCWTVLLAGNIRLVSVNGNTCPTPFWFLESVTIK